MKITATQLKQIIAEEVSNVMNEAPGTETQGFEYVIGDLLNGKQLTVPMADLLIGKPLTVSMAFELARIAGQPMDGIISALYDDPKYLKVAKRLERELLKRDG